MIAAMDSVRCLVERVMTDEFLASNSGDEVMSCLSSYLKL